MVAMFRTYLKFPHIQVTRGINKILLINFSTRKLYAISKEYSKYFQNNIITFNISEDNYLLNFLNSINAVFPIEPDEIVYFPEENHSFETYSRISNLIMEGDIKQLPKIIKKFNQLNSYLLCYHLSINCHINAVEIPALLNLIKEIIPEEVCSIQIIIDCKDQIPLSDMARLDPRINSIILLNQTIDKYLTLENHGAVIIYNTSSSLNSKSNVSIDKFAITIEHYRESILAHTYFNRKIYIGPSGEIKNSPNSSETEYNIFNINSEEDMKNLLSDSEFTMLWNVKKDEMLICKDCEFRNICVDDRIPKFSDGDWYHTVGCNYNPYSGQWKESEQ